MLDWRKHPRYFRCRCEKCFKASGCDAQRTWKTFGGKMWQAKYGELNKDFRQRYLNWHKEDR